MKVVDAAFVLKGGKWHMRVRVRYGTQVRTYMVDVESDS